MSVNLADLRAAVSTAPDNLIMRMMLVRRLVDDGELSEALGLAMGLSPDDITAQGDRAVLAELFQSAGLSQQAAAFGGAAPPNSAPSPAPNPGPAQAHKAAPAQETHPEQPPEADPTQEAAPLRNPGPLRVVAGREADETPAPPEKTLNFSDVGGLEQVKKDIRRRIILPFAQPGLVARFKKSAGGGVLLYGPPGCGKTLLARATAGECGARFLNTQLSEILTDYSGETLRRLSALFNKARENTPTVLFFDEIEALAAKRSSATHSHVGQLISHFLTEFDGVDSDNTGVLILAATNTPWAMDGAFLRAGRFDRMFFVPPPDRAARASIFGLELDGRPGADRMPVDKFAAATAGLSGADIRAVVEAATDAAIDATLERGQEVPLSPAMVDQALAGFASGVGDWLATAKDYATYANESGRYDDVLDFIAKQGKRW